MGQLRIGCLSSLRLVQEGCPACMLDISIATKRVRIVRIRPTQPDVDFIHVTSKYA